MILLTLSIISLVILLVVQICIIGYHAYLFKKNHKHNWDKSQYSTTTIEHSEKIIQAIESGKIKKQLIENDAPIYNSNKAMSQYVKFVDNSPIYREISALKGGRYYG